jgi:hypothetical protein
MILDEAGDQAKHSQGPTVMLSRLSGLSITITCPGCVLVIANRGSLSIVDTIFNQHMRDYVTAATLYPLKSASRYGGARQLDGYNPAKQHHSPELKTVRHASSQP